MGRIRTIKPEFFMNENMAELPAMARLLFIGLWTIADRRGRLADRPKRIKAELFPYDNIDVGETLSRLQSAGFIIRYEVGELKVIQILSFEKHQRITGKEAESESQFPEYKPDTDENQEGIDRESHVNQWGNNGETTETTGKEGKGKEGKGKEGSASDADASTPPPSSSNSDKIDPTAPLPGGAARKQKTPAVLFTDSIIATAEGFQTAFSGHELYGAFNLRYYHEVISNWASAKSPPPKYRDWVAMAKNWMLRDYNDGKSQMDNGEPITPKSKPSGPRSGRTDGLDDLRDALKRERAGNK